MNLVHIAIGQPRKYIMCKHWWWWWWFTPRRQLGLMLGWVMKYMLLKRTFLLISEVVELMVVFRGFQGTHCVLQCSLDYLSWCICLCYDWRSSWATFIVLCLLWISVAPTKAWSCEKCDDNFYFILIQLLGSHFPNMLGDTKDKSRIQEMQFSTKGRT